MRGEVWLQAQLPLPRRGMAGNSDHRRNRAHQPSKRSHAGGVRDHVREGNGAARPNPAHELPALLPRER
jgi:hypothetical protein